MPLPVSVRVNVRDRSRPSGWSQRAVPAIGSFLNVAHYTPTPPDGTGYRLKSREPPQSSAEDVGLHATRASGLAGGRGAGSAAGLDGAGVEDGTDERCDGNDPSRPGLQVGLEDGDER